MYKSFFISILFIVLVIHVRGQNPANITLNNQQILTQDEYKRATNSIKLQPGFKYSAQNTNAHLLNLSVTPYPNNVGSFYDQNTFNTLGGVLPPISCNDETDHTGKQVGETPGGFVVSSSGAATYEVPIYIPPGSGGVAPNLSIIYSSRGSTGILGKGFVLNGLSSITRVPKVVYLDGKAGGIEMSSNDVFALDGNRLLSLSGTYGANNSTYYTEDEMFCTVISHGQQGSGPQWIEVKDRNGNTLEFGNSVDSRLLSTTGNTVLSWKLNKFTDEFGNYISYKYKVLPGELLIDKIEYTGNAAEGLSPYNKIEFTYVDAGETNTYYANNEAFHSSKLIKEIQVLAENQIAKRYVLDYSWERVSCLSKITEVDGDGVELYPTIFCWNDVNANNPISFRTQMSIFQTQSDYTGLTNAIPTDLNGDGFSDFVCVYNGTGKLRVMKNKIIDNVGANANYIDFNEEYYQTNFVGYHNYLGANVEDADFDNLQEVYTYHYNSGAVHSYKILKTTSDASGTAINVSTVGTFTTNAAYTTTFKEASPYMYSKSDYTGDGINDELRIDHEKIVLNSSLGNLTYTLTPNTIVKPISFNGDGAMDYLALNFTSTSNITLSVLKYTSPSFNLAQTYSTSISFPSFTTSSTNLRQHIGLGDFNGDGITDVAYLSEGCNHLYVRYGTGTIFGAAVEIEQFDPLPLNGTNGAILYKLSVTDLNSDGKSDISITDNQTGSSLPVNNYFSFISTGDFFEKGASYQGSWSIYLKGSLNTYDYVNRADFNGDGTPDRVSINDPNGDFIATNDWNARNLTIEHIKTGMYNNIDVFYMNINTEILWKTGNYREQVFTKNSTNSYATPLYNYKPAMYCVYKSTQRSGIGGEIRLDLRYQYSNAIFHKFGKGFLGFETFAVIDPKLLKGSLSTTSFVSPFYVPVTSEVKKGVFDYNYTSYSQTSDYSISGVLYSKSISTYSVVPRNSDGHFLTLTQNIDKDYLNSIEEKNEYTYDVTKAGNVTQKVTTYGWNGSQVSKIATVTNDYIAVNGTYKTQKLTTSVLETNDTPYDRTTEFTYDAAGHLEKIINDPLFGQNTLTTVFSQFDNFGHPLQASISAADIGTRTTQSEYDPKGRFKTKSINGLGDFTESVFEPKFGNVIESKNTSGLQTFYEYDGLGRLTKTTLPTGEVNTVQYDWEEIQNYAYNISGFTSPGVYSITTKNAGKPYMKEYFSAWGTVLRTETESLDGNVVISDNKYNTEGLQPSLQLEQGLLIETSEPHFVSQSSYIVTQKTYNGEARLLNEKVYLKSGNSYSYQNLAKNYGYSAPSVDGQYNKAFIIISDQQGRSVKKEFNTSGLNDKVQNNNGSVIENALYEYSSVGRPKKITLTNSQNTQQSIVTQYQYDQLGHLEKLIDPSTGTTNYVYNTINELVSQSDVNTAISLTYNSLGQIMSRMTGNSGTTTYQYVTSNNGRGNLQKIIGPNSTTDFVYDQYGRLVEQKETIGNEVLQSNYTLDNFGKILEYRYPNGLKVKNVYDQNGYLTKINDANNNLIWQVNEMDASGNISKYEYGNGIETKVNRNNIHVLQSIEHGTIHKQEYVYNIASGNITSRKFTNYLTNNSLMETFAYNRDRLSIAKQVDPVTQQGQIQINNISFDVIGNITHKDDAGDYVYGNQSSPYLLTNLNNAVNSVSLATVSASYNDLKKVAQLTENNGSKSFNFLYGNNDERIKMDYLINGQLQYTRYYGQYYDKEVSNGNSKEWNYIYTPTGLAAVYYSNNGSGQLLYALSDHLGSPILLTDVNQNVVEEYSFDAWGRRRNPNDWSYTNVPVTQYLNRGFTFHEHIDELGIINMNSRIYDPVLGRFIQPDKYIQSPDNLQNFNRYSYVLNNPLLYTDPSGDMVGIVMWPMAYICNLGMELILGNPHPFKAAFEETKEAVKQIKMADELLQVSVNVGKRSSVTIGLDFFAAGVSLDYTYFGNNGVVNVGIGVSPVSGIYMSAGATYVNGKSVLSVGVGGGKYGYGFGGSYTYDGVGIGYTYNKYNEGTVPTDANQKIGSQTTGALTIYWKGGSAKVENDFLANSGDKWRSNAIELTVGDFTIGTTLYNNDPEGEACDRGISKFDDDYSPGATDFNGTDRRGNLNKHGLGAWKDGKTYFTPLWVGYNTGNTISRFGYSHPAVQDLTQNAVHLNFPPGYQNFYNIYEPTSYGFYSEFRYYNKFSLYGR